MPFVPRSSRVKHFHSPQQSRAGNSSRPQDVILESRTRADSRRATAARYIGVSSAIVCVCGALARAFFDRARARFDKSRCRERKCTRQAERDPYAGVRELRTDHPRRKRATKIRTETAKVRNASKSRGKARAGTNKIIALPVTCPLLLISSEIMSKMDAESSLSVFGVPRRHLLKMPYIKKFRKKGVGPLVSSQEHRALLVSVIDRL